MLQTSRISKSEKSSGDDGLWSITLNHPELLLEVDARVWRNEGKKNDREGENKGVGQKIDGIEFRYNFIAFEIWKWYCGPQEEIWGRRERDPGGKVTASSSYLILIY